MSASTRVFVGRLTELHVFDPLGDQVGRVRDVVVTFNVARSRPRVIGLVVEVAGRRRVFVPMTRVTSVEGGQVITTGLVNMRRFEQRGNETLVVAELFERPVQVRTDEDEVVEVPGRARVRLKVTTTSRTRPTWSPSGSKTLSSVRRPTKARVDVLTGTGYRGGRPRPGTPRGSVRRGCCGARRPGPASARGAIGWSRRPPVAPARLRTRRGSGPGPRRADRGG